MKEILCNSIQSSVLEQYLFIYIYVKKLHVCALHTHTTNICILYVYKIDILPNYTENHMYEYDTEIKENHSAVIEIIYENLKTTLQLPF